MDWFLLGYLAVAFGVFGLTALIEYKLIPILRSHKAGQTILEIGPRWHKYKEGTPTMGGLAFVFATLIAMAVYFIIKGAQGVAPRFIPLVLTLIFAVANGAIGFVDDYFKLVKKQNEGLTSKQKLFLQLVIAAAYVCVMTYTGHMDTLLDLPFTDYTVDLGWFWYPLAILLLAGVVNGANLTDGVDGLASAVTFVIGGFYTFWAFMARDEQLSMVGALLLGATLAFLIYNFHPAKVFMGDTGSLFLGALVIGGAFQCEESIVGLIVSAVFIIEMLSSFLQSNFFRLTRKLTGTGKRIFKMAPLHHHFEQCGWNEYRIMYVFSFVELLFCILAWFAL